MDKSAADFVDVDSQSGNPWSLRCMASHLQKLQQSGVRRMPCILLEDLTRHYKQPCILDIKMGTRSYPDDASAHKRARHIEKCQSTTSASLGARICGMQVC